ncbi:MAG: DUF1501 domain-containing protein [Bacteroidia bacterium]|nr:DUF1501 domain-containing protein [Bacteroidota bacterium]MBP9082976.1 DUF1501 domain-containing protein [Bacteroidia bacterium]MBK7391444.1 DUF1501 domain-containing protein [Bacteroidota bacterium]MBK8413213.1 DUF1501 domain-containing protein [Bacteroidota bacterium]MBK9049111.1 DUF1501 domain-containing protein [Bacteroidota bacterium]
MNRKKFLQLTSLASASLLVPRFLYGLNNGRLFSESNQQKKLVVIQLSGGNDGLNTFIPYSNDLYYESRMGLSYPKSEIILLDDSIGLNPNMKAFESIFKDGECCIINQVGYPNPDRSHFRSMDIWNTASGSDQYFNTGWLGRYLDAYCINEDKAHVAVEIDDLLSLALKGEKVKGLAMRNPEKLFTAIKDPYLDALINVPFDESSDAADYMYKTLRETSHSAGYIHKYSKIYKSNESYPDHDMGKRLQIIGELICSGCESQIYYVSITGFDTHANQKPAQGRLLGILSECLKSFSNDLKRNNKFDETLILCFSEFGRRVDQNASQGTDHGAANNVILVGGGLKKKGFFNDPPKLNNLLNGDLSYELDFRSIYATILDKWLGADADKVIGKKFQQLDFI